MRDKWLHYPCSSALKAHWGVMEWPHWKLHSGFLYLLRLWCWEGLGAGGKGDDRGWDGWMASLTRWTWVWVNSGRWWWTGRLGMLRFMGSQRVGHDWVTELNWTEKNLQSLFHFFLTEKWNDVQHYAGFRNTPQWFDICRHFEMSNVIKLALICPHTKSFSSVQFSRSVVSDSLRPHESQHPRPPCPSPTPGVHPDSHPSSQWCHPAISSSVVPFSSCPQSLPASESFPVSQLFI